MLNKYSIKLLGPFVELITMSELPMKGSISDSSLERIKDGGIVVENGIIKEVGEFDELAPQVIEENGVIEEVEKPMVAIPGFIDAHTHLCFAGTRAHDYALRNAGNSYLQIAKSGGGIWNTVQSTRQASKETLKRLLHDRLGVLQQLGITTVEIKSGYGLDFESELKMLKAIQEAGLQSPIDVVATCLAAHVLPKDFDGSERKYLDDLLLEFLPFIKSEGLTNRIDIFIEKAAFNPALSKSYLVDAKKMGFNLTVHADQFTVGGSKVAVDTGALSADHLEASEEKEINYIARSETVAMVLPGASMGLGMAYAPARKLLDAGGIVAIASDWNPGSAPMGNLLCQAAVLGTYEKLTNAEVLAGITFRAAKALNLQDRGKLQPGMLADIVAFDTSDYKEILYHQGAMLPSNVYKLGKNIIN